MNLEIFNERERAVSKITFVGKTVKELLKQLNLNPEAVIVVRNCEVITEEETIQDRDRIELLSVISGG